MPQGQCTARRIHASHYLFERGLGLCRSSSRSRRPVTYCATFLLFGIHGLYDISELTFSHYPQYSHLVHGRSSPLQGGRTPGMLRAQESAEEHGDVEGDKHSYCVVSDLFGYQRRLRPAY